MYTLLLPPTLILSCPFFPNPTEIIKTNRCIPSHLVISPKMNCGKGKKKKVHFGHTVGTFTSSHSVASFALTPQLSPNNTRAMERGLWGQDKYRARARVHGCRLAFKRQRVWLSGVVVGFFFLIDSIVRVFACPLFIQHTLWMRQPVCF